MKFRKFTGRIAASVIAAVMLAFAVAVVFAAPVSGAYGKTIRLGYFEFGGMFEGAEEGAPKRGYCYEYMMEVATYTGWQYEFVYGTYSELYEMLKEGKIDVLPYTNYNEQRGKEVLFSDVALVNEEYYIAVKPDSEAYISGDITKLNGKTVTTLEGADYNSLLIEYIEKNSLDISVKYYPSLEETWDALENGTADATVFTSNAYSSDGLECISTFGNKPTYIAVAPGKSDILEELNRATGLIEVDSPALMGTLYAKYFSDNPVRSSLTVEEQQWINAHNVIRIGGFSNDTSEISFDAKTGEVSGLTVDIVNGIIEKLHLGITAEYKCYDTLDEMKAALDSGEIDLIYPFYTNKYLAQEFGLVISRSVRVANMGLVYKTGTSYQDAVSKIATPATRLGIYFVNEYYPESQVVKATSVADAVEKVIKGEALGAVAYNDSIVIEKDKHAGLNMVILMDGCGTCFATTPENHAAIMILNRGMNFFSSDEISALAAKHTPDEKVSTFEYLSTHTEVVVLLALIAVILVVLVLSLIQMSHLKKKADEANNSKTNFLFNMSHDIRTPMNAITGFTDMAIRHIDEREILEESLEKAKTSSDYLLKIINNILDMARIESGKLEIKESLNHLDDGHKIVIEMFGNEAAKKGITLHYDFDLSHDYLWLDGDHMLQIIANLLSNAIKYTNPGGEIWYSVKQYPCEKAGYGKFVVTVKDNGLGMSPEFQKRMFDAFERDQSAIKNGTQGTGLGMAIVKKLADAMGSKIDIKSELGQGTEISITSLHRFATQEEIGNFNFNPNGGQEEAKKDFTGKKVLLVEDNELNREISIDILEEHGLVVDGADDGSTAVKAMKEKGPDYYDYILMDIQMPIMNGYEATRKIRAMFPDKHIPIIALSANAFAEDKEASMAAGMDDHVAKPINTKELFKIMSKY